MKCINCGEPIQEDPNGLLVLLAGIIIGVVGALFWYWVITLWK